MLIAVIYIPGNPVSGKRYEPPDVQFKGISNSSSILFSESTLRVFLKFCILFGHYVWKNVREKKNSHFSKMSYFTPILGSKACTLCSWNHPKCFSEILIAGK